MLAICLLNLPHTNANNYYYRLPFLTYILCCTKNKTQIIGHSHPCLDGVGRYLVLFTMYLLYLILYNRAGGGSQTFFSTHGNHLPSLLGVHGLKDFLHSDHLHEWFDGRIYTYWSVLKSKFVHQRTHEDGHYRENPSNHELLTVRGGDCCASNKMCRGLLPP